MGFKFNPFTGTLDEVGAGGGGSPGGSDTYVQFNDGGSTFGGDVDFTWNKTTNVLGITGDINLSDGGTYTTTLQTITPTAARTISFPDATGTVALVGGSSGNLIANQSGAYAGVANSSVDNATGNITLGSRFISSLNGAASAPPGAFTGTWFSGGTATTTKPQVLIEPTGTTSTAWSTSGTGLGVNAASGFAGNLLDLQVNGTSVVKAGTDFLNIIGGSGLYLGNSAIGIQGGGGYLQLNGQNGIYTFSSASIGITLTALKLASSTVFGFTSGNGIGTLDIGLSRTAAGVVKVTDGSTGDGTISAQHRLVGTAPATASSTGTAGDIRYDASYIYICIASNTWKRAAITTWV